MIRPLLPQTKVRFLKIPLILTITALPTTVVVTATLVVMAGPTVAATMAPPVLMALGSRILPGRIPFLNFGPIESGLAHLLLLLLILFDCLLGPETLRPSLLPPFPLHLRLLLLHTMDILMVFLVHVRHKVITPGLMLL